MAGFANKAKSKVFAACVCIVFAACVYIGFGGPSSSASELEGRWELVSLKAQGQNFQVAGQKCFGDSFFEISGDEATVGIVGSNPDGSCNRSAGKSGHKSLGGGKYALSTKGLGEFWLKGGTLEYKQAVAGQEVVFVFKKSAAQAGSSANSVQTKSSSSNPVKDPGVRHSDAGADKKAREYSAERNSICCKTRARIIPFICATTAPTRAV